MCEGVENIGLRSKNILPEPGEEDIASRSEYLADLKRLSSLAIDHISPLTA